MAEMVFTPTNPHFFQPILPDPHCRPMIPVSFLRHVEGKRRLEPKSAILRSDGSDKIWRVKIDGRRFACGWEQFAAVHDLNVGDIVLFRHEGHMTFYVTLFDSSGCEKQYAPFCGVKSESSCEKEKSDNKEETSDEDSRKSDVTRFVANVTSYSLRHDRHHVPVKFAKANDFQKRFCNIEIMNEEGRSWLLLLRLNKSTGQVYIRGWRNFCFENDLKEGDSRELKLSSNGRIPVLIMKPAFSGQTPGCSREVCGTEKVKEKKKKMMMKKKKKTEKTKKVTCSARQENPRFLTLKVTRSNLERNALYIPLYFSRSNGLHCGRAIEVNLVDTKGNSWPANLSNQSSIDRVYLTGCWRSFCAANELNEGDSVMLKLVPGEKLKLKYCSRVKVER